ncbi:MAG: glycoside hydrolase family 97 protein [Phycisphaerae bacterium]|nr:glycoside hydrolase family 97 protein [Phycisphaerae bacterium]
MKIKFTIAILSILFLMQIPVMGQNSRIISPDGQLAINIAYENSTLSYGLTIDGKEIIKCTPISITIDDKEYPGKTTIKNVTCKSIDNEIIPTIPTITSKIDESCSEALVQFDGPVALRIRAYNDGVAFRWESKIDKPQVIINSEQLSFNFAQDYNIYYPVPNGQGFFSHQENMFEHIKISETATLKAGCTPALVDIGNERYILMTDVNVEEYPGLWLKGSGTASINAVFPHYPAETKLQSDRNMTVNKYSDFLAKTNGTRTYPWRTFVITDAAGLLESTMLYTLANPCQLKDTSWIKPGKVSWDWWNAWNITDVDFKAGINQKTYKNYIDFAAANKLQYIILDEGWSVRGPENLLKVASDLDISGLVEYGKAKNIGVILWMTSAALEYNFDKAFEQFAKWGIKGLKVDFMQRDDQLMMDFCAKVAKEAAKGHLLVDFHGGSKPTGLQRTWPNVIAHESVLGLEQSKWSRKASPDYAVLLPFIRMAVGPMDYTPGAMDNYTQSNFKIQGRNPGSLGTRCHQLAMYVTFLSPLQMLADTPTKYRKNPECMPFLQEVPTTWDETVVLKAEVGKEIAIARRNGNRWFIGAMTNWSPRDLSVKLDFLTQGNYTLRYWADGPKAAEEATDTSIGKSNVTAGSELKIKLAPGGGYAAIIEPK